MAADALWYYGNVNFNSYPPGGEVFLDGMDQGVKTPVILTGVPIGEHIFTIRLDGYGDFTDKIEVLENQTVNAPSATLVPAAGCIYFDSRPAGAKIFLNGTLGYVVDTGFVTPKAICNLSFGTHVFRLVLHGYPEYAGSVNVKPERGDTVIGIFK